MKGWLIKLTLLAGSVYGCGGTPFVETGVGYDMHVGHFGLFDLEAGTRQPLPMDCAVATLEVGAEYRNGISVSYFHQSCIDPTRGDEKVTDAVMLKKRWGGVQ